jgi:hypothetical protein
MKFEEKIELEIYKKALELACTEDNSVDVEKRITLLGRASDCVNGITSSVGHDVINADD